MPSALCLLGRNYRSAPRPWPVSSKERFWKATQDKRTDQHGGANKVPAVFAERNDPETVQQRNDGHCQKERPSRVTMYSGTPERVYYA